MEEHLDELERRAKAGDDHAIVELVKRSPGHIGVRFVRNRFVSAKDILRRAARRPYLDRARQLEVTAAEDFVEALAEAVRFVPDETKRWWRKIHVAYLKALMLVTAGKPHLLKVAKSDRRRPSTWSRLARRTGLTEDDVRTFLCGGGDRVRRSPAGA